MPPIKLRHLFLFLLAFIFALNSFGSDTWKSCRQNKKGQITIHYYNSDNFISDATGELSGIEYELLKEFISFIKKKYGIDLKPYFIRSSSFSDLYEGIKYGRPGEFGACSFSITEARKEEVKFSPRYMPDVEVLISSSEFPVAIDTAGFREIFKNATALSIPNSTYEQNIKKLKDILPGLKIENEKYSSNIRKRITKEHGLIGYIELPTYLASLKSGFKLKRQLLFKVERSGYGIIYPLNSDWTEPLNDFFSDPSFPEFMKEVMKKYFGEDVEDLLLKTTGTDNTFASKEIALLTKEREVQGLELSRQELEIRNKNILVIAFISGFVLMLALVFFILRGYYQKKKANVLLSRQKQQIEIINRDLKKVLDDLSVKNKEITDSINYAKTIQQAKLPRMEEIQSVLKDSFILFKPKDIVSGDFYFFYRNSGAVFIAAADCTGHGVPGAFMSIVGSERLEDAVAQHAAPSAILNHLNIGVKTSLRQSNNDHATRDGMDIALCYFDLKERSLKFSGANRPIWIIRKGNAIVEEIKATKKAIGGHTEDDQKFEEHDIKLNEGDTFYIFSDGYADTFNAYTSKKLTTRKFKEILSGISDKSMKEQLQYLDDFIEKWKGKSEQVDDILVIGVRV